MAKLLAVVVSILLVGNANSQADGDINADGVCSGYRVNVKGTYMVWWYGDLEAGTIQINASVDNKGWIAVGISNDKMMTDTDVVIGAINGDNTNESFIEDRYAFARNIPRLDAESNIYNTTVMLIDNDHVMISFMRRLDTGDDTDDISLTGCHYLLWAWAGLVTDYGTPAAFGQHGERGVFNDQICCGGNTGNAGAAVIGASIGALLMSLAAVVAVLY